MHIEFGTKVKQGENKEFVIIGKIEYDNRFNIVMIPIRSLEDTDYFYMRVFVNSDDNGYEYSGNIAKDILNKFILKHKILDTEIILRDRIKSYYTFNQIITDLDMNVYKWSEVKKNRKSNIYVIVNHTIQPLTTIDYHSPSGVVNYLSFVLKDEVNEKYIYKCVE